MAECEKLYRLELSKITNVKEYEALHDFYQKREKYMIFNPDNPKFVGKWFESDYQQEYD